MTAGVRLVRPGTMHGISWLSWKRCGYTHEFWKSRSSIWTPPSIPTCLLLLLDRLRQNLPSHECRGRALTSPASLESTLAPRTEVAPFSSPVKYRAAKTWHLAIPACRESPHRGRGGGRGDFFFFFFLRDYPQTKQQASLVCAGLKDCGPLDLAYFDVHNHTSHPSRAKQMGWVGSCMHVHDILRLNPNHALSPTSNTRHEGAPAGRKNPTHE